MVSPLWNPSAKTVALRKESVDRNLIDKKYIFRNQVALRKESVDRNKSHPVDTRSGTSSLSARRAWIEIVLLRMVGGSLAKSLSARRAWIEIESRITEDLEFDCRSPQGERG